MYNHNHNHNHKMNSYGSVSLVSAAIYKMLRFMNWFPPTPNVDAMDAICIDEPEPSKPKPKPKPWC
jgi:hypothetical protein